MINYLAYGSNLCRQRLVDRVGPVEVLGVVRLADYRLAFTKRGADGSGKCTLVAAAGAASWGVIYRMPAAMQAKLDRIEGLGIGYTAAWWELDGYGPCYVYLALDHAVDEQLVPFAWYQQLVIAGAPEHALPAAYIRTLENVAGIPDPDLVRARRQLSALAAGDDRQSLS